MLEVESTMHGQRGLAAENGRNDNIAVAGSIS